MFNKKKFIKWSKISLMHYYKLLFRSALLIAAVILYVCNRVRHTGEVFGGYEKNSILLGLIWVSFVLEMCLRFFPSRMESPGCQKQFRKNYKPGKNVPESVPANDYRGPFLTVAAWLALNGLFGWLYLAGIFDDGIMLIISLAYSVCDMICILFFCPFQTWFMKNKCCGTCRIYNWDYLMMFTPLFFVKSIYTWSILIFAIALFIEWEYLYAKHPERFSEDYNQFLKCGFCEEKLCIHKKQLLGFHAALKIRSRAIIEKELQDMQKRKEGLLKLKDQIGDTVENLQDRLEDTVESLQSRTEKRKERPENS